MQEERNQVDQTEAAEWDEEDRYSGVGIIGKVASHAVLSVEESTVTSGSQVQRTKVESSSPEGAVGSTTPVANDASSTETTTPTTKKEGEKGVKKTLNANAAEWKPSSTTSASISTPLPTQNQMNLGMVMHPGMMMPPYGYDGGYVYGYGYPPPMLFPQQQYSNQYAPQHQGLNQGNKPRKGGRSQGGGAGKS